MTACRRDPMQDVMHCIQDVDYSNRRPQICLKNLNKYTEKYTDFQLLSTLK